MGRRCGCDPVGGRHDQCQHRLTAVDTINALPDLTLPQCCERWGVSSRNSIKARAKALGVQLVPVSSTCTIWPGEHVELGDQLNEYLKNRGKLAEFPHKLTAPTDSTGDTDTRPLTAPAAGSDNRRQAALTAPAAGSEALAAFAGLLATMQRPPVVEPLAVPRALAEAADAGHWLSTTELAMVLGVHRSTVGRWVDGDSPRPGYQLQRRKGSRSDWWLVTRD